MRFIKRGYLAASLAIAGIVPIAATPIDVTISGNFGTANMGSPTIFDNQNYTISFLIPNPALPDMEQDTPSGTSAYYAVTVHLLVPGIGASLTAPAVEYLNTSLGQELYFGFTGSPLPADEAFNPTDITIDSGDLWNGLAGALGTPVIDRLDNAPGMASFALEQATSCCGPIPIGGYSAAATITATAVPEPASVILCGCGLSLLGVFLLRRTRKA